LKVHILGGLDYSALEFLIDCWDNDNIWEKISDKTVENVSVFDDNFWPIEILKTSLKDDVLKNIWFCSLETTSLS